MSPLDDDEVNRLFEQHRGEQLNAGFRAIVENLRDFRELCKDARFTDAEAFDLTRDLFAHLMDHLEEPQREGEE